jgi:eukaryotic-like serine/threonine-protein kinase
VNAHGALGQALLKQGRFAKAKTSTQRALELLPDKHPQRPLVLSQLQQCNQLLALEAKLADVLAGKAMAAGNRERFGLLEVCRLQSRQAAAARLYADAFNADAKLADDLSAFHRYNAACAAALAAAGQGNDADKLDDKERSQLRKQALEWLRADLTLWSKRLEDSQAADRQATQKMLQHWQTDTDLAGVRDAEAMKTLPAEEQVVWRQLWADVAQLLKKTDGAK